MNVKRTEKDDEELLHILTELDSNGEVLIMKLILIVMEFITEWN